MRSDLPLFLVYVLLSRTSLLESALSAVSSIVTDNKDYSSWCACMLVGLCVDLSAGRCDCRNAHHMKTSSMIANFLHDVADAQVCPFLRMNEVAACTDAYLQKADVAAGDDPPDRHQLRRAPSSLLGVSTCLFLCLRPTIDEFSSRTLSFFRRAQCAQPAEEHSSI